MGPFRIELRHWGQDKATEMKTRMWNGQAWLGDKAGTVKEDIEVDRPWSVSTIKIPTQGLFHLTTDVQQAARSEIRRDLHDSVQKPCVSGIFDIANRLSFVK
jgi:hypothetical protein